MPNRAVDVGRAKLGLCEENPWTAQAAVAATMIKDSFILPDTTLFCVLSDVEITNSKKNGRWLCGLLLFFVMMISHNELRSS
jgi:hypothetical protein